MMSKFYLIAQKFFKQVRKVVLYLYMLFYTIFDFMYLYSSKSKYLSKFKFSFIYFIWLLLYQIVLNRVLMLTSFLKSYVLRACFFNLMLHIVKLYNLFQKSFKKLSVDSIAINLRKLYYYIFIGLDELLNKLFLQNLFTTISSTEENCILNQFHLLLANTDGNNEVKKKDFIKKDASAESKISNKQIASIKKPATITHYELPEKIPFPSKKDPDEGIEKFFGGIVIFIVGAVVIMKYGNEWFGSTPLDIKNSPFYVPSAFENFMKTISDFFKNSKK